MSKAKELLQAILSGEGYNEAFKAVMAEKIGVRIDEEKAKVVQSIFNEEKTCDCDYCEEDLDGKCAVCGMKAKNESYELDESVDEKKIKKDLDSGMSPDAVIGKHANKKLSNTDAIRKVIQKHAWEKRMKKEEVELDESAEHNKHTELKLVASNSRQATRLLKGGKTQHVGTALYKGHKYTDIRQAEDGKYHALGTSDLKADSEQGAVDLYHASKAGADARKVIEKQLSKKSVTEDFDILDERELTPDEMKKREKYVLSMKKNKADFEKRYGERAKEVMYATATKMAKGEMNDSVEIEEFLAALDEKIEKEGRVNYFEEPEEAKKAGKRYSDVASMFKAKRQKPIARPSNIINASYEEDEEQIEEALVGNQHKLDHDKDGKIEASDLKSIRIKKDVSKALDKHIEDYNSGGMDADELGSKTVAVQKMIAKKHGISPQDAIKHVNDHVESKIEG